MIVSEWLVAALVLVPAGAAVAWVLSCMTQSEDDLRACMAAELPPAAPRNPVEPLHRKAGMANPWLKKNPFLSLWLSAAHRGAGLLRGQTLARARQQAPQAAGTAASPPAAAPKTRRTRKG